MVSYICFFKLPGLILNSWRLASPGLEEQLNPNPARIFLKPRLILETDHLICSFNLSTLAEGTVCNTVTAMIRARTLEVLMF